MCLLSSVLGLVCGSGMFICGLVVELCVVSAGGGVVLV